MIIPKVIAWPILLAPWLLGAAVIGWLFLQRFPMDGVTAFAIPLDGSSPWFDAFLPGQRTTQPGPQADGWTGQRVFREPVYGGLRVPGAFDDVAITIEARFLRQPIVELGMLRDPEAFSFEMHPVWSEALSRGWRRVELGGREGFVREGEPDEALLSNEPETLMLWHATATLPGRMDASGPWRTFDRTLRGAVDLYAIPANGEIAFRFLLQDANRNRKGGNTVAFRLSKDDETVWTDATSASGSRDRKMGEAFEKTVKVEGLASGIYRLQVIADDDLFIRRLSSPLAHWVFGPRAYFGDEAGWATSTRGIEVWTNSLHFALETFHREGKQTVTVGSASTTITKTHEPFRLDRSSQELAGMLPLRAPQGDVRVIGDGYFAFDRDLLFLPRPRRLTDASDPVAEGVNAVLTSYVPPEELGDGWVRLRTSFTLAPQDDRPKLSLAAPGVFNRQGAVDIRRVDLTYRRPPLKDLASWWTYVRRELANAWRRL